MCSKCDSATIIKMDQLFSWNLGFQGVITWKVVGFQNLEYDTQLSWNCLHDILFQQQQTHSS